MSKPDAVLLDAGGIFVVPQRERIVAAFARAGHSVDAGRLDAAHYRGAATFTTDLDVVADWAGGWTRYLDAYIAACGVAVEERGEVHDHVDSEFADAALWNDEIEGCREGLAALAATGVRLGMVSNADGLMARRLRDHGILQVGNGPGVAVECIIDSGDVGVLKPDVRIFKAALDALDLPPDRVWYVGDMPAIDVVGARRAGIRPFIVDPLGIHAGADYDTVSSLTDLAARVERGD